MNKDKVIIYEDALDLFVKGDRDYDEVLQEIEDLYGSEFPIPEINKQVENAYDSYTDQLERDFVEDYDR
jgi:hypothetical protein